MDLLYVAMAVRGSSHQLDDRLIEESVPIPIQTHSQCELKYFLLIYLFGVIIFLSQMPHINSVLLSL